MANIDFPSNPTIGQQFTAGGVVWTWDGVKWTPSGLSIAYLPIGGGTVTGNLGVNGQLSINAVATNMIPAVNGAVNLGSASARWGTVYTSDLVLNNGVGDWTIVEGTDDLFITNNKSGRKYKFALIEVK